MNRIKGCKKCYEFFDDTKNLLTKINEYIDSIDEINKTNNQTYKERLNICQKCRYLKNGICIHCGCFVIARAIKKNQICPYPNNNKWKE